jgi:hypothetical protein
MSAMGRAQLRALLASGASIVFDARARELTTASDQADGDAERSMLPPFFTHTLLKNVILLKTVERASASAGGDLAGLQTRLYFPFDNKQIGNGGMSLVYNKDFSRKTLETFFGVKIEAERVEDDLAKVAVLGRTPSFSPFLLRDAFERAGVSVDMRYFRVSDEEAELLRGALKGKLKPLAAMALNLSPDLVGNSALDLLARKLWELDDPHFLLPLARALKIPETDTIDVFYAWIGVSYFPREFGKRQAKLRLLAEWLGSKPPFERGVKEEVIREFEDDRKQVRERVRWAWMSAGQVFERYSQSYDALIAGGGDARPFVEYLKSVRADFAALGARLSVIEQCLSFYEVTASEEKGSQLSFEILREVARSMREAACESDTGKAAAA